MLSDSRCWQCLSVRNRIAILIFAAYLLISSVFVFRHFKHHSSAAGLSKEILSVFFQDNPYGVIDIHIEDAILGHTGEVSSVIGGKPHEHGISSLTSVAIGGGLTSKGIQDPSPTNVATAFQLFHTFLPTFCDTASPGYAYHFYFAYDVSDSFFSQMSSLTAFQAAFYFIMNSKCSINMTTSVHLVQCSHAGKPTWAQNDAMREAYLDNMEYYYRINDDTRMQTKGWLEEFIRTLAGYKPPNVGVVGPNHSGGNTGILTYDFVHQTHINIFGYYYPRLFTDWWGDDWITGVYVPGRSTKLNHVRLAHTMSLGQRYRTDMSVGGHVAAQIDSDKQTLIR